MSRATKAAALWNWSGLLTIITVVSLLAGWEVAAAIIGVVAVYLGGAAFCIAFASVFALPEKSEVKVLSPDALEALRKLNPDLDKDIASVAKRAAEESRKNGDQ